MKLWDKGYTTDNVVDRFTVGNDRVLDLKLAIHDVVGNVAHAKMLHSIGILTSEELDAILDSLAQIEQTIINGNFVIEESFEDVHSKVEFELVKLIGDAGKKIHTARSRNDQVLVDLHLYTKDELSKIKKLVKNLFNTLMKLAEQYQDVIIPGYTHTQVAMPSSFGLWFSAYAECLVDDIILLNAAYQISDQNPLGSAAGYGSSFPINREMTTSLMGFSTMRYNVVAAQMSRGKLEKTTAMAMASISGTISKMSSDVCLYTSQNFDFMSFPKELTTGSSIMPHKQNPDVFELLRAKSNKIQNLPTEIMMITNNLTSGYHRDFQLLKEAYMGAIDCMKDNLEVCEFMFQHVIIKENIIDNPMYDYMYSVENLNKLVGEGMSFRDAYQQMGKSILAGNYTPEKSINHTHEGSIGNLCLKEIRDKFEGLL